jgi:hypothetical protein
MRKTPLFAATLLIAGCALADDIFEAAKRGDLFAVEHYLRKRPESVASTDANGYTPLHWAAVRGNWEEFETLLDAGAPVNAVGADGGTPLHWACHHDRPDMVRLLLEAGAEHSIQNRWGRTALHVASRRGCDLVVALLLSRGADPDATTNEGWTALHVAYKAAHRRVVKLLLEGGADPSRKDDTGKLAADYAGERPREIAIDESRLQEYVGRYALGEEALVKVWPEKGRLRIMEFAPDELYAIEKDIFYCRREPWRVSFRRDEAGEVERIEIDFLRRKVTGRRLPEYEYVGSHVCGECHTDGKVGSQYVAWMESGHGHAYWDLHTAWAKFLASRRNEYRDIEAPSSEWRCLKCHVTGAQDPEAKLAKGFTSEEGVGCEACHGPGSAYADSEIMAERRLFLQNGGRLPDEETCRRCHEDDRFRFDERLAEIAHPLPE